MVIFGQKQLKNTILKRSVHSKILNIFAWSSLTTCSSGHQYSPSSNLFLCLETWPFRIWGSTWQEYLTRIPWRDQKLMTASKQIVIILLKIQFKITLLMYFTPSVFKLLRRKLISFLGASLDWVEGGDKTLQNWSTLLLKWILS